MKNSYEIRPERKSWWELAKVRGGTETDRRNFLIFLAWMLAWAVTFLIANWCFQSNMELPTRVNWLVASIPAAFAITAGVVYLRFLRKANPLLRQTQLEGLALGFGAGVLFFIVYRLFEQVGAPSARVSHIILVMMFGWIAGLLLGMRHHR